MFMLFKLRSIFFIAVLATITIVLLVTVNTVHSHPGHEVSEEDQEGILIKTTLKINGNQIIINSEVSEEVNIATPEQQRLENLNQKYVAEHIAISNDNQACDFILASYDVTEEKTTFNGTYTCPTLITSIDDLAIHASLYGEVFSIFNHTVDISLQGATRTVVFTEEKQAFPEETEAQTPTTLAPNTNQQSSSGSLEPVEESDRNTVVYVLLAVFTIAGIVGSIWFYRRKKKIQ